MKILSFIVFIQLLSCYATVGQTRTADSLKNLLKNHPQEDTTRVVILNQLAFEQHFHDPVASINYSFDARLLADKLAFAKGTALSYRYTGLAFWAEGNYDRAAEFLLKGLRLADSIGYVQAQADITGNLGLVYNGVGNYSLALKSFEASLSKQRQLRNKKREIVMLNNMGDAHRNLTQYNDALKSYQQSLDLGQSIDYLIETNMRNIGNVYEAMGVYDKALEYYEKSKVLSDRFNDTREMTQVRKSISSVYLKLSKLSQAEREANEALTIAKTNNLRGFLADLYEMLSQITDARANFKESLKYYRISIAYRDSTQDITKANKIASLQLDYEIQRKQQEIVNLEKDALLKDKTLKSKNTLIISMVVVVVILAFSLFNFMRHYSLQKELNTLVTKEHQKIVSLNEEIRSQQDLLISQRDALIDKNASIELLHNQLAGVNQNLEKTVDERTAELEEQNKTLEEYAFMNAHKLRAPVARILGIINLLDIDQKKESIDILRQLLKNSSNELDQVTRSISASLNERISSYERKKMS